MSAAAIILIEHLTENSNGFMTAKAIRVKLISVLGLIVSSKTIAKYRHQYLGKQKGGLHFLSRYYLCFLFKVQLPSVKTKTKGVFAI